MRWLFGLSLLPAAALVACGPPPPPPMEPVVAVAPEPALSVAAPEPPPAVPKKQVADDGALDVDELAGAWAWTGDVQVFFPDGSGEYYRDGEVCYLFTFTISGHVVTTLADRDHSCGAKRENDWIIHVHGDELHMKHGGSGYETEWKRTRHP